MRLARQRIFPSAIFCKRAVRKMKMPVGGHIAPSCAEVLLLRVPQRGGFGLSAFICEDNWECK